MNLLYIQTEKINFLIEFSLLQKISTIIESLFDFKIFKNI